MAEFKPNTKASQKELERRRLHLIKVFDDLEKYIQKIIPSDSVEDQEKEVNNYSAEDNQ